MEYLKMSKYSSRKRIWPTLYSTIRSCSVKRISRSFKLQLLLIISIVIAFMGNAYPSSAINVSLSTNLTTVIEYLAPTNVLVALETDSPFTGSLYLSSSASIMQDKTSWEYNELNFSNSTNGYRLELVVTITSATVGPYSITFTANSWQQGNQTTNTSVQSLSRIGRTEDSILPSVVSSKVTPLSAPNNPVMIDVTTSENADCKYSNKDTAYDNMTDAFSVTGGQTHSRTLTGMYGEYTYYVRCKDINSNKMHSSHAVSFIVQDSAPTARILLSDPSPVKAGLLEIKVIASEDLAGAPRLEYSYSSSGSSRTEIPLQGSKNTWTGYLAITPEDNGKVGSFFFSGIDVAGNQGTMITEGKLFVVDTAKPPAPISIGITRKTDSSAELEWYYEGEEVLNFNVYRKESANVDYIDLYSTSASTQYLEGSLQGNKSYFYRVSAVDRAGNNGQMSAEVSISPIAPQLVEDISNVLIEQAEQQRQIEDAKKQEQPPTEEIKSADLQDEITKSRKSEEKILKDIRTLSVDLEWAAGNLAKDDDPNVQQLVETLQLSLKPNSAREELAGLEEQVRILREQDIPEQERLAKLDEIGLTVARIRSTTPKSVRVVGKSEFAQPSSDADYLDVLKLYFGDDDKLFGRYSKDAIGLQDKIEVVISIVQVMIENIDRTRTNLTLVQKHVSFKSPDVLNDAIILEIVPKEIAQTASDLDVRTANFEILKDDPILLWKVPQLSYQRSTIEYAAEKYLSRDAATRIRTLVIPAKEQYKSKSTNNIAGSAIRAIPGASFDMLKQGPILIGLIIITILSAYYMLYVRRTQVQEQKMLAEEENAAAKDHYLYIKRLIHESATEIARGNYPRARVIYEEICGVYRYLPENAKSAILPKCVGLHKKLEAGEKNEK